MKRESLVVIFRAAFLSLDPSPQPTLFLRCLEMLFLFVFCFFHHGSYCSNRLSVKGKTVDIPAGRTRCLNYKLKRFS